MLIDDCYAFTKMNILDYTNKIPCWIGPPEGSAGVPQVDVLMSSYGQK